MRFIFLVGGFVGFALTAATGLFSGREPDLVLRDATIGCLIGALLFRWFWSVLVKALTEALKVKRAADAIAAQAAEAAHAKTK